MSEVSALSQAIAFVTAAAQHPLETLQQQWELHPFHIVIEVLFAAALLYFARVPLHKARSGPAEQPTKKERDELIAEFSSEVFRGSRPDSNWPADNNVGPLEVVARTGHTITVVGGPNFPAPTAALDLATFDFHGLSTHPAVLDVARRAVAAYGVGSCGPRGFYGSVKPHLDVEADIARFLGTDACIVYSFSFATVSTLIPCFASRGDYLLVDAGVSLPLQQGCHLSRSATTFYRHRDVAHVEELMRDVVARDAKEGKLSRRFVVTEGLFRNSGDICPLPQLLELCERFRFRIVLEDSYGFGALGATGRGTPEHFGEPFSKIDIYVGSLAASLGAVGGFCAGAAGMVDHQRLAATGYVFSASLPPYMTSAASASLALIDADPAATAAALQRNARAFREEARRAALPADRIAMIDADGDASPIVHFRPAAALLARIGKQAAEERLNAALSALQRQRLLALRHLYSAEERVENFPSLRVVLKSTVPAAETALAARIVCAALATEFGSL